MKLNKRMKITWWKLYYWTLNIIKGSKHRKIDICDEGWSGIKTIRNDLLARAFLKK